ncbi:hypothetical protein [Ammoniphilus sp. 3BR4]|uniref:hypothetical protein n=1 Tax=Ammoniphilus sp. 3BR4 TaxID=3158265 RepID=UPI003465D85F
MNTSPISTWEGAAAYYTFGAEGIGVSIALISAAALLLFVFIRMIQHENHCYQEAQHAFPLMTGESVSSVNLYESLESGGFVTMAIQQGD